jgi:activator of 2-hydroxyglutaryl-CoA dehydratase
MTGGVVAHNPFLVFMAEEIIGRKINVAEHPQLTGAVGAALYAMES